MVCDCKICGTKRPYCRYIGKKVYFECSYCGCRTKAQRSKFYAETDWEDGNVLYPVKSRMAKYGCRYCTHLVDCFGNECDADGVRKSFCLQDKCLYSNILDEFESYEQFFETSENLDLNISKQSGSYRILYGDSKWDGNI